MTNSRSGCQRTRVVLEPVKAQARSSTRRSWCNWCLCALITTALTLLYQWKNFCRKMRVRSQQRSPIHSVACAAKMWHDAQAAQAGQQTIAPPRTRSRARLRTRQSVRNRHPARRRRHRGRHHRHHRLRLSNHPLPVQRSVVGAVVAGVVRRAAGKVARQAADQTADRTAARQASHQADAALDRHARVPRYDPLR